MRLIDLDDTRNCYVGMDGEYEQWNIDPNVLAEAQSERKTGTWCVTPNGKLVCSNCYKNPTNRIIVDGSVIYDMTPIKQRMKFCPNCGSYNGGEEHEID